MPATRTLTADGLPNIIADAALSIGWPAAKREPAPERAVAATGRPQRAATGAAVDSPSRTVLHTYRVAG